MKKTQQVTGNNAKRTRAKISIGMQSELLPEPTVAEVAQGMLLKNVQPEKGEEVIQLEEIKSEDHLENMRVAILSEDGFEQVELTSPKAALEGAGARVDVISPHDGTIMAWDNGHWGKEVAVDVNLRDAKAGNYDAIVLPGGVMNPDKLRQNKSAVLFLKQFIRMGKPIAAICHGVQTLIETGMIKGKTMTSYPSLKTDLKNAGVNWVDTEVVHFGQFITSRRPADLVAFNREIIYALSAGRSV